MKITVESWPMPGNTRPKTTMKVDATVDEIKAAHLAMVEMGFPFDCTPAAILAKVCQASRTAAQEAFSPV